MPHHVILANQAGRNAINLIGQEDFDNELMLASVEVFGSMAGDALIVGTNVFVDAHLPWDSSPADITIMIAAVNKPLRRRTIAQLQYQIARRIKRLIFAEANRTLRIEVHIGLVGAQGMDDIMRTADEQARLLSHNYVGTEHLLAALIRMDEGDFADVRTLNTLGLTPESVTANIIELIGEGGSSPRGDLPQTPRFQKAMRLAGDQAMPPNATDAQRVFRGILIEGEGIAAQIIVKVTRLNLSDIQVMLR